MAAVFTRREHRSTFLSVCLLVAFCLLASIVLVGCGSPKRNDGSLVDGLQEHRRAFGEFELPRKIGSIVNLGVQLPQVSPDGLQMLYLRTDRDAISPMTILGSADPNDTPTDGCLAIWLRPTTGTNFGRRISSRNWAHSPTWSPSGRYVAYVAADRDGTSIVRVNLLSGRQDVLAGNQGVNILPTFDGDDGSLLFCHADKAGGPFEIRRQAVSSEKPVTLTPPGMDCLFPVCSDGAGKVICGRVGGAQLDWVEGTPQSATQIVPPCGSALRPAVMQTWAGISTPVSPGRTDFLFYDMAQDRVAVSRWSEKIVRRHRPGSIAACWLTNDVMALATADGLFAVNAHAGVSVSLLSGAWVPLRYIPSTGKLYLLAEEGGPSRLAIYELAFHPSSR